MSQSDEPRLRATEVQMRRALGLPEQKSPASEPPGTPSSRPPMVERRPPRRFARDGQVAVTILHRDHDESGGGTNKLDAAQAALREQIEAREHAETLLREAQATIRDLQTKLAHERLDRDEGAQRAGAEQRQLGETIASLRQELEDERVLRAKAAQDRHQAIADAEKAADRLRQVKADARPKPPIYSKPTTHSAAASQPRRRGRPPKVAVPDNAEVVEWWVPGWQKKFR
jgi:hypothetical protein